MVVLAAFSRQISYEKPEIKRADINDPVREILFETHRQLKLILYLTIYFLLGLARMCLNGWHSSQKAQARMMGKIKIRIW